MADDSQVYDAALAALKTPAEEGLESGEYALHTGDSAYVPDVAPDITPYDERESTVYPRVNGTFETSDEQVVSVDENGRMTANSEGSCIVIYHSESGDVSYTVTVSDATPPELIKNFLYVLNLEFNTVRRSRLDKGSNKYCKWYYKRKNSVGWCSVFTIYCANAAGIPTPKEKDVTQENMKEVQFFAEGYPSNQYEAFLKLGRFTGVPKAGYLILYADTKSTYLTTHIAAVTDVQDLGGGIYRITTVEGNMSNTVKSYCFLYDSTKDNSLLTPKNKKGLQDNMMMVDAEEQTNPTVQYTLRDHFTVFGFCQTW